MLVIVKDNTKKQQYVEQRACGTYITSIPQLKATFDYFIAVQSKKLSNNNIVLLNK